MRTRLLLALPAALLALGLSACAQVAATGDPTVAATVNGEVIPIDEVTERFEAARANPQVAQQLESDASGQFASQVQGQILAGLIRSELLQQGAEGLGIEVTDEDVAAKREELIEEFGGEEAFEQAVSQSGFTPEQVEEQLRDLVYQDEVEAALTADIEVSDEDIAAAYEADPEGQFGEQRQARHILVETQEEAESVLGRLEAGEDFAELARELSTDTGSGAQGGDLGSFGPGQMVPPFEEAVFGAEVGEVVGPVETEFGFHIIEVTGITPSRTLDEASEGIRTQLEEQQRGAAVQQWLAEQQSTADIEVNPRFGDFDPATGQVAPADPLGDLRSAEPAPGGQDLPIGGDPGAGGAPGGAGQPPGGQVPGGPPPGGPPPGGPPPGGPPPGAEQPVEESS